MSKLTLKRIAMTSEGTFGVLISDVPFALTLERKWLNNQRSVSCIPSGEYKCLRCSNSPDYDFKNSPRFGNTFQIMDVPDRSHILFHKGNLDDDSHGCVLIGEQFGQLGSHSGILSSKQGFNEFMDLLEHQDEFDLTIEPAQEN